MSDKNVLVKNNVEYYKNGSVKAYESVMHHKLLNKTVKVRDKEHQIYLQKFKEAMSQLSKEWEVVEDNNNIKSFITSSGQIHIFAYNQSKFSFRDHIKSKIKIEEGKEPIKPVLLEIPVLQPKPLPDDKKYIYIPKWYHKLFNLTEKKKMEFEKLLEVDLAKYNEKLKEIEELNSKNQSKLAVYEDDFNNFKANKQKIIDYYDSIYNKYSENSSKEDVLKYFNLIFDNKLCFNGIFKDIQVDIDFDTNDSVAIVDFRFPSENEFPSVKEYKYVKTRNEVTEVPLKEKERNSLIKDSFYSLYIAIAHDILRKDAKRVIKDLVLNGYYKGIDKRKGNEFEVCIMTSKIDMEEFKEIDFNNIDPKDTFKYFSGKGIPDPDNVNNVEPIRFNDKSKFKLIDSDSVLSNLSADTNLAAMDWKDFETLIRDVFELEFREQDIEIRNTQHSNDGGIDVVAFNKNPYTGGIILLQAKRYTNTVTPEPVRALKGSMEEHKAIRGILATTSDFGGSSREFAGQHNITLINGEQLVELLKKHGYNFHVDIEQARIINGK